jgi:hypothetical protein
MVFDSILCGLSAFVFIGLLCQPYEVFGWWPVLLRRLVFGSSSLRDYEDMKWWQLVIYKPLAACPKCFAGWLAVAVLAINPEQIVNPFPNSIYFVCVAVFTAWGLEHLKEHIL